MSDVQGKTGTDGSAGGAPVGRWIDRTGGLAEVVARIGAGPLALDSEADSFHRYRERVCLIQLSFGGENVLVDPLSDTDLSLLAPSLADPAVPKILHGADYDIRLLQRDCALVIRGLFDTMVAARLVGERSFGLSGLLERWLDVRLDKRFQRADWAVRPLPPEMADYAVRDTCHLEQLAGLLRGRLERLERVAWAEEEFARLEQVRWEPAEEPPAWMRVKGWRGLTPKMLAVLRELAALRDEVARRRDVPLFRVMRDEVLLELARVAVERGEREVDSVRGVPRPWTRGSRRERLRSSVARGLGLDEADWPAPPRLPKPARPTREEEARLRRVRRARDRVADSLDIEPSVLAPRAVLERLVSHLDAGRPPEEVPDLRRWQLAQLGPVLEAARE